MLFWNRFREKFGFLVAIASNFSFHPFRKPRGGGHVDADAPEPQSPELQTILVLYWGIGGNAGMGPDAQVAVVGGHPLASHRLRPDGAAVPGQGLPEPAGPLPLPRAGAEPEFLE